MKFIFDKCLHSLHAMEFSNRNVIQCFQVLLYQNQKYPEGKNNECKFNNSTEKKAHKENAWRSELPIVMLWLSTFLTDPLWEKQSIIYVAEPFQFFVISIFPCSMTTSSNENIFRVIGPLCGEFTGDRWIPRTKACDAELWCFLWYTPE